MKKILYLVMLLSVALGIGLLMSGCGSKEGTESEAPMYQRNEIELPASSIKGDMHAVQSEAEAESTAEKETTTAQETKAKAAADLSLKSLKINKTDLAVNIESQDYPVSYETEEVTVNAAAKDVMSSVISGTGKKRLNVGSNRIEIVVRGADGSKKTYVVNIIRAEPPTTQPPTQAPTPAPVQNYGTYTEYYAPAPVQPETPPPPTVPANDGVVIIG